MNPILSICIPTFNRPEKIKLLLNFLEKDILSNLNNIYDIEVIVGDNSSDEKTQKYCIEFLDKKSINFEYYRNEQNLGLVGNIISLYKKAKGEYCWFMGDDDIYHKDIIKEVYKCTKKSKFAYIFINHKAFSESDHNLGFEKALDNSAKDIYNDGKELAIKIWEQTETSLMFMSSSIHKRTCVRKAIESKKAVDIAYPLYLAFFSASQGKAKFINKIYIDNVWGEVSWENQKSKIFNVMIPRILLKLPKLGYGFITSKKLLLVYLLPRIKGFLVRKIKG